MNQLQTNIMTFHAGTEIPSKSFVPRMVRSSYTQGTRAKKKNLVGASRLPNFFFLFGILVGVGGMASLSPPLIPSLVYVVGC